jgi:hypothetical protein
LFGLLGGLLGGGLRGAIGGRLGGGALSGLLNKRGGGGQQQQRNTQPEPSKDAPMTQAPEEQGGQQQAEQQPQQPQQPQAQQPVANQMAAEIQEAQPKQPEAPLQGLLDEAPAAPKPQDPAGDGQPPPPQTVVNQTEMATPIARPVDERFGEIPVAPQPDTLRNQLLDSGSNTQPFDYEDGNPSRQPSLSGQTKSADQGYRYVGPSGVDGALPPRRYR